MSLEDESITRYSEEKVWAEEDPTHQESIDDEFKLVTLQNMRQQT